MINVGNVTLSSKGNLCVGEIQRRKKKKKDTLYN